MVLYQLSKEGVYYVRDRKGKITYFYIRRIGRCSILAVVVAIHLVSDLLYGRIDKCEQM